MKNISKNKYLLLVKLFIFILVFFAVKSAPTALASCSVTETQVSNTLSGVSPSSGTYSNPSSIFINASGHTTFICIGGMAFRGTYLDWVITNSSGQTMASGVWGTPGTWDNPIAGGAVNYDGSPLGFSNGYGGESVSVSSWPAGTYTLRYTSSGATGYGVDTTASLSSSFTITRPSLCVINSFSCDGYATLAWSTSGCSSVSLNNGASTNNYSTGNTTGVVGTTYTLTADGNTSSRTCPVPSLTVSGGGSQSVSPGQQVTLPFSFSNTGQSGSIIHYLGCNPFMTGGISLFSNNCPSPYDLTAP